MLLANVRNLDFKEDYIFTCTVLLQKGQTKLLVYFEPIKLYLVHFLWHQTGFFFFFWVNFKVQSQVSCYVYSFLHRAAKILFLK